MGTEQGHPMSPELFKLYTLDFSGRIKEIENTVTVPCLNESKLSHLLWADDLILLALNEESLQILLNQLKDFCDNWGLVVNMTKTQVMVFNRSGRKLKAKHSNTETSTSKVQVNTRTWESSCLSQETII